MAKTRTPRSTKSTKSSSSKASKLVVSPTSANDVIVATPAPQPSPFVMEAEVTLDSAPDAQVQVATRPTRASHITHDDIARRAFEIYQRRGGTPGRQVEDWIAAERELATHAA